MAQGDDAIKRPLGPIPYLPPKFYCPFGGHYHPPDPCPYCYPVQNPN